MGFWDFFKSDNKAEADHYLRMLVKVARADGQIDEKEYRFLQELGTKLNKTPAEIDLFLEEDDTAKEAPPRKDRLRMIFDLVCIMMVDRSIDDNEMDLCTRMAMRSGFEPEMVQDIVYRINQEVEQGLTVVEAYEQVYETLKDV